MAENVDRDQVLISIDDKLRPLKPLSADCCIYRVPEKLQKVNEDAYRPWVVSIGPFHHGDPRLEPMQEHKLRYWQSFCERNRRNDKSLYVQLVREKQEAIRDCYNQQIKLDDDTFVEMVLLDAAFIIELLVRLILERSTEVCVTDHICDKSFFTSLVLRDLKLEENQLPFFILNGLYSWAFPQLVAKDLTFIHLSCLFFTKNVSMSAIKENDNKINHFVDLLRRSYLWSMPEKRVDDDSEKKMTSEITFGPSVTELHEAGVKFKVTTSDNLFDISFRNGVLEIPRLTLEDNTETLFRNMIAFEQFHHHPNYYISDYFAFLDSLINTTKDVEILVKNGIIDNWLGSYEEAAKLINNMGIHVITLKDNFYYSDLCQRLNEYKSRRWPRHRAALKRKYFSHPWAVISLFYATVLLILAVLQVVTGFRNG